MVSEGQERGEAERPGSERWFHALVQNALDLVMVTDPDGTIRYVSPSVQRVLGYAPEEMVGTLSMAYVHPDDAAGAAAELQVLLSRPGVRPVTVETRVRHKDGSWRHLEGIASNLLEDPAVEGLVFNHRDVTERVRAEEEIRRLNEELRGRVEERTARLEAARAELGESEERFRLLVEGAADYAIFMLHPDGRIATWNEGAHLLFGYAQQETVGEPGSVLFTPEDLRSGVPERELEEAAREGRAEGERWYARKDGSRFWASGFVRPVRDESGSLRGFAKVARDITDRKETEDKLRESEERFRATFEQAAVGVAHVSTDGRLLRVNDKLCEIFGYAREEMLGLGLQDLGYPEDHDADLERVVRVMSGEMDSYSMEKRYFRKDGSLIWANLAVSLVHDPSGEPAYFIGAIEDITERRRAEDGLRRSEEWLSLAVESAGLGIWDFDPATKEVKADERAATILGIPPGAPADYDALLAKVHPDDRERVDGMVQDAMDPDGSREYEVEYRVGGGGGGAERWMETRARAFFDGAGRAYRIVGTVRDVTERRRAVEAQRFLAEASEVLSSSLDYRTTLSAVARLAVPTLADWCALDVLEEDGSLERLAVEHPDPEKVALAYKLQERYPPDPNAPYGVFHVLRTGEPEMMSEIPEEFLARAARDEEHRGILGDLGLRSYMTVPLIARGRTFGVLSLVSAESGRRYGEADLELARELARRAALAVDNSRLFEDAQREIAEREWAQAELRGSRDQLDIILSGVADGIIAQDASGRIFYANEAAATMSGYPSVMPFVEAPTEERLGRFELLDAEGLPFPLERLPGRRALHGEEGAEEVLRFRSVETGEERWSVVGATPVFDAEGRVRMAVSILRDITEQRRAEQERARLAAIVESSEDAIISKTLEGIITSWNRGAERIYGYSADEVVGRSITVLVPPERPDEIPGVLAKIRRGEKVEHYETVRVAKDGRRLDISLAVSPVKDSAGNVMGASTIARDITERKRIEAALRETREAERRRIARDLHDGVLQDLSYAVQIMEITRLNARGTGLEGELREEVDALRDAVQELRVAVYDLRLADELDQPFPDLLASLLGRNRAMAPGQDLRLEVKEGFPSAPLGEAGVELLRIVQEALTNARRHSGARDVLVTLGIEGEALVVEVSDDGRGFGSGTALGVGLRSMRERAASIGGELEVRGETGEGTTVRLRAPMPRS